MLRVALKKESENEVAMMQYASTTFQERSLGF